MSKLSVTLYRAEDQRILKAQFSSDYDQAYDYLLLTFRCSSSPMTVVSTSAGSIDGENNVKMSVSRAEIFLSYSETSPELECLVGYYVNNELLDYETLTAHFDNSQAITSTEHAIPHLTTIPGSFPERFDDFLEALSRRTSSLKVILSCAQDILMRVESMPKTSTTVIFGENQASMLASDYVFQLDPGIERLHLPIEIIEKQRAKYSPHCKLGVFEIVKPDFIGQRAIYYKSLISNLITLSDIAKA